ncbi:dickkopf-related protein 2-like isoform X2 [Protopterus annectens]|uniref:dickkopf-related protein 2-like isoform X2 n=1 Tax=Protopterus annectens TaxID=7888 RepID=UPI001CF9D4B9|nr:dickkopf-related protein 2-like isoform X2 [Protopterus annectens]
MMGFGSHLMLFIWVSLALAGHDTSNKINKKTKQKKGNFLVRDTDPDGSLDEILHTNKATETQVCSQDEDCEPEKFCSWSTHKRPVCLPCKKKHKSCQREGVCCKGNHCINGICIPYVHKIISKGRVDVSKELTDYVPELDSKMQDDMEWKVMHNSEVKVPHLKGQDGDTCNRASDCATGFCCSQHLLSKVCKPLLQEGEVCTKPKDKGVQILEKYYQRCDCSQGLSCRLSEDKTAFAKSRLSTCQKP